MGTSQGVYKNFGVSRAWAGHPDSQKLSFWKMPGNLIRHHPQGPGAQGDGLKVSTDRREAQDSAAVKGETPTQKGRGDLSEMEQGGRNRRETLDLPSTAGGQVQGGALTFSEAPTPSLATAQLQLQNEFVPKAVPRPEKPQPSGRGSRSVSGSQARRRAGKLGQLSAGLRGRAQRPCLLALLPARCLDGRG